MLLKEKDSKHLIEVLQPDELFDPMRSEFTGRYNFGEEMPETQMFLKDSVCFQSGEPLPRCWMDIHYRDQDLKR